MTKLKRHKWEKVPELPSLGRSTDVSCIQCGMKRTQVSNGRGRGSHFEHWVVVPGFGRRDGQLDKELRVSPGACSGIPGYYSAYDAQRAAARKAASNG